MVKPTMLNRYRSPRPVWLKAIGDTLLGTFGVGGCAVSAFSIYPKAGSAITMLGIIGHICTQLYNNYDRVVSEIEVQEITTIQTTLVEKQGEPPAENKE